MVDAVVGNGAIGGNHIFARCALDTLDSGGDPGIAMFQCISDTLGDIEKAAHDDAIQTTNWLLVFAGALIFFMQAGFAMLVGGCVRKKNLQNTMLKNLLDVCGAAIAFWSVGYAFAYGLDADTRTSDVTFVGTANFFGAGLDESSGYAFWFFQLSFCAASVTIVAGTLAERCQMAAYLWYSLFLTGFVYPVVVHAMWSSNGKFSPYHVNPYRGVGCIDFAGSGVVHLTGGTVALVATFILGPRVGRFHDSRGQPLDVPAEFPGHSVALQVLGTFILWFGWYGFNPGSALGLSNGTNLGTIAALSAANTTLAAGSGALSAMTVHLVRNLLWFKRLRRRIGSWRRSDIVDESNSPDVATGTSRGVGPLNDEGTNKFCFNLTITMNGCLAGLVAITAGSATVHLWAACIIGLIAGLLYVIASDFLLYVLRIDDAVDAIPVHMVNGAWGLIATGLFSAPGATRQAFGEDITHFGWFYNLSDGVLITNQIIAVCLIATWAAGTMTPFFLWLNHMGWFRSDGLEEVVGLDIRYHGGNAEVDEAEIQQDIQQFRELLSKQLEDQNQGQKPTAVTTASSSGKNDSNAKK